MVENIKVLNRNIEEWSTVYDLLEGIISGFSWDLPKNDLILSVYYNWDFPNNMKDKNVRIRFLNCHSAYINLKSITDNSKIFSLKTPWQEVDDFHWQKKDNTINAVISSNIAVDLFKIECEEIWLEYDETQQS